MINVPIQRGNPLELSKAAVLRVKNVPEISIGLGLDALLGAEEKWKEGLSISEKKALLKYSSLDHIFINDVLRSHNEPRSNMDIYRHGVLKNKAVLISQAIRKFQLPDDFIVYRGIHSGYFSIRGNRPVDLIGEEIKDAGFLSTSLSKDVANSFGNVLLKIYLEPGDPAAFVANMGIKPYEHEILIDKGQTLVITGFKTVGSKIILDCNIKRN